MTAPGWLRWAWLAPAAFIVAFLLVPLASLLSQVLSGETLGYLTDPLPWRVAGLGQPALEHSGCRRMRRLAQERRFCGRLVRRLGVQYLGPRKDIRLPLGLPLGNHSRS